MRFQNFKSERFFTLFGFLFLSNCAGLIHYQNAGDPNAAQEGGPMIYQHPAVGDYLCLAVPVGTPIYSTLNGEPNGVTSDVVAFGGRQQGNLIQIVMPEGEYEWIDGQVIKPYGTAHPGHTCYVFRPDGIHPKFVIQ
jgi:hypothetical protein